MCNSYEDFPYIMKWADVKHPKRELELVAPERVNIIYEYDNTSKIEMARLISILINTCKSVHVYHYIIIMYIYTYIHTYKHSYIHILIYTYVHS